MNLIFLIVISMLFIGFVLILAVVLGGISLVSRLFGGFGRESQPQTAQDTDQYASGDRPLVHDEDSARRMKKMKDMAEDATVVDEQK